MRKPGTRVKRAAADAPAAIESPAPEPAASAEEPAIVRRLEAPSKWGGALVAGGLMLVAGLSFFAVRGLTRRK